MKHTNVQFRDVLTGMQTFVQAQQIHVCLLLSPQRICAWIWFDFDQLWVLTVTSLVNSSLTVWARVQRGNKMREFFEAVIMKNGRNRHGVKSKQGSTPIKRRNQRMGNDKATYHCNNIRTPAAVAICLLRKHVLPHSTYHILSMHSVGLVFLNTLVYFHTLAITQR